MELQWPFLLQSLNNAFVYGLDLVDRYHILLLTKKKHSSSCTSTPTPPPVYAEEFLWILDFGLDFPLAFIRGNLLSLTTSETVIFVFVIYIIYLSIYLVTAQVSNIAWADHSSRVATR